MSQSVFGAAAVVTMLNRAFNNSSPAAAVFGNQVQTAGTTADSQFAFARQFGASFDSLDNAALTNLVLGNMGMLPDSTGLVDFVTNYLDGVAMVDRGVVVLQLGMILAGLENATGDLAVYAPKAVAWNKEVEQSFIYSSNSANTSPYNGDFVDQGQTFTLTDGIDNIVGNAADNTISAPVVQNQNGELVNSLETGDSINGGAGVDTLNAVLTNSQGTDDNGNAPAISATLSGVEVVNYRAQFNNNDGNVNGSHIDAELHSGVQQYWSDNSRADLQIEDVRQLPEELTFGMRQTDSGVGYNVYFDPAQLAADRGTAGDSSLTLTLVDNGAGASELANFPVNGVVFTLGGTQYTVQSAAMGEADTYAAFVTALEAALVEQAALADVTVTLNANNTITLTDPAGATFGAVGYTWVGNIVPAGGELQWNQAVGAAVVSDAPITTDVVLDAVGRTSQGGTLDIGSMADGGVEVFNVSVDRSSWLTAMESRENFGGGDRHLETVNLTSIGANGDLAIGNDTVGVTGELDGRVVDGLIDVREVLNVAFTGELNYGVSLNDDAIGRYLDVAAGEVVFTYEGGAGNDNITIADDSTGDVLSDDADFAMDVTLAAGDDRLNLDIANVDNVSIDGGTGANVIAVARSHGTTAANTFEGFANFQTYEVEGTGATQHDFTSMAGVTTVNIATDGGDNTELRDLAADTAVVITGKNQTLAGANASNANQTFGNIAINGADATATDTTLRVTLQNTARLDGTLTVGQLAIGNLVGDVNPIRTLELVSAGQRNDVNVVTDISAALVNTFNLSGTQDLTATITAAANSTAVAANRASLVVNGADLTGDLDLTLAGAVLSDVDAGTTSTNTLTGTAGTSDDLRLSGVIATTDDTTISGFETIHFGRNGVNTSSGLFDATNVSGVTLYNVNDINAALTLDNLANVETVEINTDLGAVAGFGDLQFNAESTSATSALTLNFRDADAATDATITTDFTGGPSEVRIQDFRTVTMDLGGAVAIDEAYVFDINLIDGDGSDDTAAVAYNLNTVDTRTLNVIGGGDQGAAGTAGGVDTVNLGVLTNALSSIDLSAYVGRVTFMLGAYDPTVDRDNVAAGVQAFDRNTTVELNGYGANITETDEVAANDSHITTFVFTADAVETTEDVVINGFDAFNDGAGVIDLTNLSVLDLSALGVDGLADLTIAAVADVDTFTAGAQAGVLITSNEGLDFQIGLVGITLAELSNENFQFAA